VTPRPASEAQWRALGADIGRLVARRLPGSEVEDVVQDVLLRVWRHAEQLRDDERFGAWLSRIARTAVADHFRAKRAPPPTLPIDDPETTEPGAKAQIAALLRPFAEQLPARYREAVILSELEGLPYSDIAARLGLSLSGVKSRVQRGRRQLRALLERCCEIGLDARNAPVSCRKRGAASDCSSEAGGCASPARRQRLPPGDPRTGHGAGSLDFR
jgi:RNA polymerase sigma-70 factor (ECF subfamily)